MKLYYSAGACSLSPHIVLRELGNKFELEAVDLGTKQTKSGKDYTKINPKGYVPALELENGEVLTEGPAIVQYLADKANSEILPKAGTMDRYRAMEMLNFITVRTAQEHGQLSSTRACTPEVRKATIDKISKRIDHLDAILGKHPYVLGDKFSVADAYAFTVLAGASGSVSISPSGRMSRNS